MDYAKIANGLGAKIVNLPEISKEESAKYEQAGSPVMLPTADKLYVYHNGTRMLDHYGMSLDDVVGYRVLDTDEEPEFRKDCGNEYATVVCFYTMKK